jgi:hypothetical protein
MKKALLTALLGFAAVAKSHATGYIWFDNYDSNHYMPVIWGAGNGSLSGTGVADPNVHVDLLYYFGITSNPSQLTALGLSVPINPSLSDGVNQGYFDAGVVSIPGYVSGPVTFQVKAWETAGLSGGPTYDTASIRGASFLWTEPFIAGSQTQPAGFFNNLPGPDKSPLLELIPEPSILALSSIGLAALVLNRSKKQLTVDHHSYPNAFTNGSSFSK